MTIIVIRTDDPVPLFVAHGWEIEKMGSFLYGRSSFVLGARVWLVDAEFAPGKGQMSQSSVSAGSRII